MRILVIEGDKTLRTVAKTLLELDGHVVSETDTADEGAELGKIYEYDGIVLGNTLPDFSAFDVIRLLRSAKIKTPIVFVDASAKIEHLVRALSLGADDYIVRPFHRDEFLHRLKAVVRRAKGHAQSVIEVGKLAVHIDVQKVFYDGRLIYFTPTEYRMMELLALRNGMTITKTMFLDHIYGGMDEPELKMFDVMICKLRRKLAATAGPVGRNYIKTVWGRGFVLEDGELNEAPAKAVA